MVEVRFVLYIVFKNFLVICCFFFGSRCIVIKNTGFGFIEIWVSEGLGFVVDYFVFWVRCFLWGYIRCLVYSICSVVSVGSMNIYVRLMKLIMTSVE